MGLISVAGSAGGVDVISAWGWAVIVRMTDSCGLFYRLRHVCFKVICVGASTSITSGQISISWICQGALVFREPICNFVDYVAFCTQLRIVAFFLEQSVSKHCDGCIPVVPQWKFLWVHTCQILHRVKGPYFIDHQHIPSLTYLMVARGASCQSQSRQLCHFGVYSEQTVNIFEVRIGHTFLFVLKVLRFLFEAGFELSSSKALHERFWKDMGAPSSTRSYQRPT